MSDGKISKSDQDPHQGDADRSALDAYLSLPLKHWAIGSEVLYDGHTWTIRGYDAPSDVLLSRVDGHNMRLIDPPFLSWGIPK